MFNRTWEFIKDVLAVFFPPSCSLTEACEIYTNADGRFEMGMGIQWFEFEAAGFVISANGDIAKAIQVAHIEENHFPNMGFENVYVTLNRWRRESTASGQTQTANA